MSRPPAELPEHVRRNRAHWDEAASDWAEAGERSWRDDEPSWGNWGVPEADVGVIPEGIEGMDAVHA